MLDLFSIDKTPEERLEDLKSEIKAYQKKLSLSNSKIKLFYGDIKNFNDGVLVISNPPKAKFFETPDDKYTINLLLSMGINKFYLTYNYLVIGTSTPKEIKLFGYYIRKLIDIINPKIIVCMGERSQFCFFKKKFMMIDFHGKQIGDHEGIPIYTTYPISYYIERSKFENESYKELIKSKDWKTIKDKYANLKTVPNTG
jgi:uracil-DNA glycosylase